MTHNLTTASAREMAERLRYYADEERDLLRPEHLHEAAAMLEALTFPTAPADEDVERTAVRLMTDFYTSAHYCPNARPIDNMKAAIAFTLASTLRPAKEDEDVVERVVGAAIKNVPTISVPDNDGAGTTRLFVRIDHMADAIRTALASLPTPQEGALDLRTVEACARIADKMVTYADRDTPKAAGSRWAAETIAKSIRALTPPTDKEQGNG